MFELQSVGAMLDIIVLPIIFVVPILALLGLFIIGRIPGQIAAARGHRWAKAVNVAGWVGLLSVILWPIALIWAFMNPADSDVQPTATSPEALSGMLEIVNRIDDRVSQIENFINNEKIASE